MTVIRATPLQLRENRGATSTMEEPAFGSESESSVQARRQPKADRPYERQVVGEPRAEIATVDNGPARGFPHAGGAHRPQCQ
jgi:hypothetical protein